MKYEAKWWAKLLQKVEQYLPRSFEYKGASPRPHPWQIRPVWVKDAKLKYGHWRGIVTAGLVNAIPTYVTMIYEEATDEARKRVELDAIANKKPIPGPKDSVKIYLDEMAEIKFNWRKVGSDGSPDSVTGNANSGGLIGSFEKVPDFFKRMGVADANPKILEQPPTTQRLLRACDIVLHQPRTGLINTSEISAASIDTTLVSINPSFVVPPDTEPYLAALSKYVPVVANPATFADLVFQRFIDTPFDQIHLSTVYLLSPQLPLLDEENLEGWQCYFKYNCHYNLVHATQQIERRQEFVPISLVVPLAGGLAQPVISYILAENNFFAQATLDFYQQRKLNGKFYAI